MIVAVPLESSLIIGAALVFMAGAVFGFLFARAMK